MAKKPLLEPHAGKGKDARGVQNVQGNEKDNAEDFDGGLENEGGQENKEAAAPLEEAKAVDDGDEVPLQADDPADPAEANGPQDSGQLPFSKKFASWGSALKTNGASFWNTMRSKTNSAGPYAKKFGSLFVSQSGGLTLLFLLPLAYFSYFAGNSVYENLQRHYQKEFLFSTAKIDVISQICNSRSDILWEDCNNIGKRGTLSDRLIWSWLTSADIIDPLIIPTPSQLTELSSKDRSAEIVYRWLKDDWGTNTTDDNEKIAVSAPQKATGVNLLLEMTTLCFDGGSGNKEPAMRAAVTAYLSDVYPAPYASGRWLSPELRKALGLQSAPVSTGTLVREASVPVTNWIVPMDPREIVLPNKIDKNFHERRAPIWAALMAGDRDNARLDEFLDQSKGRLSVASHVGDEDLVATLFTYGGLIDFDSGQYVNDFGMCGTLEKQLSDASGGGSIQQTIAETTFANFEKLALYTAGRIRVSPESKRARFWVSIYTGHEQRWILIFATFGLLVVGIKITIFAALNMLELITRRRPALSPFENPVFDRQERDNEFDGLASSRWAMKIPIALLPAIGFVGTVRGIMLSLSGADAIVWAETVNERSSAISGLSADLGLAFATTLLALLGGAVLTFLTVSEMALGERLLLRRYAKTSEEKERDLQNG